MLVYLMGLGVTSFFFNTLDSFDACYFLTGLLPRRTSTCYAISSASLTSTDWGLLGSVLVKISSLAVDVREVLGVILR